ncbi:MAG: hypothetical protein RMK98_09040, partial [Bacteroidia bacterium]|nr:hypothetical protein [Bacteroidia bacterium]
GGVGNLLLSQGPGVAPVWLANGAVGSILMSMGPGSNPVWSPNPICTSPTLNRFIKFTSTTPTSVCNTTLAELAAAPNNIWNADGAAAPDATDKFSIYSLSSAPWAINAYASHNGAAIYASVEPGNTTAFSAIDAIYQGAGNGSGAIITHQGPTTTGTGKGIVTGRIGGATNAPPAGTGYYGPPNSGNPATQTRGGFSSFTIAGTGVNRYTFGAHGAVWVLSSSTTAGTRTGGVLGSHEDNSSYNAWGALGYRTSGGTNSGVYGSSTYSNGGGYNQAIGLEGAGGGFYGGVVGSWSRSEVIGTLACGELLGSYTLGPAVVAGYTAEIVSTPEGRKPVYATTSPQLQVYTVGRGTLQGGKAEIRFDKDFQSLLGEVPIVIVTPQGPCRGIYVSQVTKEGFTVEELNGGSSEVPFAWMAFAQRRDARTYVFPEQLLQADFDEKLRGFMFNENIQDRSALPMWWDGRKLRFDPIPDGVGGMPKKLNPNADKQESTPMMRISPSRNR